MPLFPPNNLQGAQNEAPFTLDVDTTEVSYLEWGHFIDTATNLLMANGSVQLSADAPVANVTVTVELVQTIGATTEVIDTRTVTFLATVVATESIAFGARELNKAVGHHVFRVLVTADVTLLDTIIVGPADAMTVSGATV